MYLMVKAGTCCQLLWMLQGALPMSSSPKDPECVGLLGNGSVDK